MDTARFAHPAPSPAPGTMPAPSLPASVSGPSRGAKKRPRTPSVAGGSGASGSASGGAAPRPPSDLSKVRAFAACRACRQKKVKCLPGPGGAAGGPGSGPCQQCTLSGAECEYQPTRDRAAYSRAYVQDLSGRVQALESMQQRLLPLLSAFEGGKLGELAASGAPQAAMIKGDPDSDDRDQLRDLRDYQTQMRDLQDGAGDRDRDDMSDSSRSPDDDDEESRRFLTDDRGHYRWIGASNTLSLLDSFGEGRAGSRTSRVAYIPMDNAAPSREGSPGPSAHPYFGPVAGAGVMNALPGVEEVTFPPRAEAENMVNAFFAEVHPVLPVLLEPDFRRRFHALLDRVDTGDMSGVGAGFMSIVFAVFALGERVLITSAAWERERNKQQQPDAKDERKHVLPGEAEAGVIWCERAQVLHFSSIREIDIHQVQCLTLMSAFQASINSMPMSWLLASQALRIAQDIGLHRAAHGFKVSFKVKQLGARCWWAIYGLERLVSITLGRPLCVEDQDIDVAYPVVVDDETVAAQGDKITEDVGTLPDEPVDCTMSGFVALTKLCKIAGRVAQLLYRPSYGRSVTDQSWAESQQRNIDKLDRLLRDWLAHEVPQKYKDASSSRNVSLMSAVLSNSYFAVLITLHRNLLPSNPDYPRPKAPPSSQSLAHCVDAARSVIHVAAQSRVLVPVSHHLAVFCQYLWSSAVILLLCETRAREQIVIDAVGAHIDSCRTALRALEPVWPGCRKLGELLNDVESRAKEVRAAAISMPSRTRKRKSPSNETGALTNGSGKRQAAPKQSAAVPDTVPGSWTGGGPSAAEVQHAKFETSDTRSRPPFGMPQTSPSHPSLSPSHQVPSHGLPPHALDIAGVGAGAIPFDFGDMTFDGLAMLNAFTSDAWAQAMVQNTPTPGAPGASPLGSGTNTTPLMGPKGASAGPSAGAGNAAGTTATGQGTVSPTAPHFRMLGSASSASSETALPALPSPHGPGQNTPGGAGPSGAPSGTASGSTSATATASTAWFTHGLGPPAPSPAPAPSELAEIWAQIAGESFDWQADPSVPFNI